MPGSFLVIPRCIINKLEVKVFIAFVTGDFGTFVPKAPSVAGGILSKSPSAH